MRTWVLHVIVQLIENIDTDRWCNIPISAFPTEACTYSVLLIDVGVVVQQETESLLVPGSRGPVQRFAVHLQGDGQTGWCSQCNARLN